MNIMEVASPLSFAPIQVGSKRSFACSPPLMDGVSSMEVTTEENSFHMQQPFKRRRFHASNELADSTQQNAFNHSPLYSTITSQSRSPFAAINGLKRCRTDGQVVIDNQRLVQDHAEQIGNLKNENTSLVSTVTVLRTENERVVHENKILKKAVTIQQERYHQVASELDAARRYKVDADEKIRMLEHMVMTLRYHLQAQQVAPGNDFMNNSHRPPDVY